MLVGVTRELALLTVTAWLREEFGRLLEPRDVRRMRRAAGDTWAVRVVAAAGSGDVFVAEIEVDEHGALTPQPSVDEVIAALQRPRSVIEHYPSIPPPPGSAAAIDAAPDDFDDLNDDAVDDGTDDPEALRARVQSLLMNGSQDSLRQARALMPRLLGDPDRRGITLLRMAEIERRLAEKRLALDYLEAAAREFADRFDMSALEKSAAMALDLLGKEEFLRSSVHALLEQCRARLMPLESMFQAPGLAPVRPSEQRWLALQSTMRTLSPGDTLVHEGDRSQAVFVIRSGLIGVFLEKPTGGQRMVRCCFPGWLLGESSVLVEGDPRCTATLRAQRVSEVWELEADALKEVMRENPELRERIAETKQIHRIDSFFSMHEAMGQLDVMVRDEMIGCIQRIQTFDEDTVVLPAGDVPAVALLVARGEVAIHQGWDFEGEPIAIVPADRFLGVRDALHQIPIEVTMVAKNGATIAFFDAERLRALVAASGEHVATILERLG